MPDPLVTCIPNFSEGRRTDVIDALVATVTAVADVRLLHRTSDADHNRTVLTVAGPPQAVAEAIFRVIALAAEQIDLRQQRGVHPRLGATDVVPFVPTRGITMDECVVLARGLGERVGAALGLPVYLYEAAATRPERRNLADVRRGEYEDLVRTIHLPERQPDYGPAQVGPAGAVIIGARQPLIAFNIYLTTTDVQIAKHIARAVRHSNGGLAGVKALGLLVDGQAQVSMNLTDYRRTPVHRVVEMVRSEASRYGVAIARSELIGLIPEEALLQAAAWYMQLHEYDKSCVLEQQLFRES